MRSNLLPRVAAEFTGTAFLLASIIGSGIMAERLSGGNAAITLFINCFVICMALVALISAFGKISGAHFNPVVTFCDALAHDFKWRDVPVYFIAQLAGAFVGTGLANVMFGFPVFFASTKARAGWLVLLGEFIATFGLMAVIWGTSRFHLRSVPYTVAAYIFAAIWFTSSASFANPAVTLARSMSDTYTGIRPADVLPFIVVQFISAIVATFFMRWLLGKSDKS
jgi:glycerol uptake facilitator-like aquaporin